MSKVQVEIKVRVNGKEVWRPIEKVMQYVYPDKIDIKGYALVAWDEKGTPCLSWSTVHNKTPISEMLLPTFTQSCFQGILNKKLSTTEDLNE